MDTQEFLRRSYKHVMSQTQRCTATDGGDDCAYAGPDGAACAIGCVLPRELAVRLEKAFPDGAGWITLKHSTQAAAVEARHFLADVSEHALSGAQAIHDCEPYRTEKSKRLLDKRFRELAARLNVTLED